METIIHTPIAAINNTVFTVTNLQARRYIADKPIIITRNEMKYVQGRTKTKLGLMLHCGTNRAYF